MSASESTDVTSAAASPKIVMRVVLPSSRTQTAATERCLASLTVQSEPGWELGRHWEIVVVNIGAAAGPEHRSAIHAGVRVLQPGAVPAGWTARTFACSAGAEDMEAGDDAWLLFTEADALFAAGSASRSLVEANRYGATMLAYAPLQRLGGTAERLVMPLVLSEIANAYPPAQVNDPERRLAYADPHFLLVRADAYVQLGGYQAVAASPVPEVDLAFLAKRRKVTLRYRYAPEAISTGPSGSFAALRQHWTGTLAVLIDNSMVLALWRVLDVVLVFGLPLLALYYSWYPLARLGFLLLWARTLWRIYRRARKSNAQPADAALSILGLPVFIAMLAASWYRHRLGGRL